MLQDIQQKHGYLTEKVLRSGTEKLLKRNGFDIVCAENENKCRKCT